MLPESKLSSKPVPSSFLTPMRKTSDVDYEWGGVGIRDTSQGLQKYIWRSIYSDGAIRLSNGAGTNVAVVNSVGIDHHSFAFDQNMNPCVVYNKGDKTFMYWYDTATGGQTTTMFEHFLENPQVSLDDHRRLQVGISDVILSYIRDGKLYYRLQRERYLQEHYLADTPNRKLMQTGMTRNLRFRWRHVHK